MSQHNIKGIIWDFGNIFASFYHAKSCGKLAQYSPMQPEDIYKAIFGGSKSIQRLHDSGAISSQEFFSEVQKSVSLSKDLSFQEFCDIWKDIFQENKDLEEIINNIKPGIRQCILSNTDPIHWSYIEQLPIIKKHFSNESILVRSYVSGVSKPETKIYLDAIKCLELEEEDIKDIVYIDDVSEYREKFESMGGNTISYDCSKDDVSKLKEELRRFSLI